MQLRMDAFLLPFALCSCAAYSEGGKFLKQIQGLFLLLIGTAAAIRDLRYRRIPNSLLKTGLLGSLAGTVLSGSGSICFGGPSWKLVLSFLAGAAEPLLLLFILYYFHMIGAGDIKLYCVFGSYLGPVLIFQCIIISILIGGIFSVFQLFRKKNLIKRFRYLSAWVREYMRTGKRKAYITDSFEEGTFSFSIPIVLAYALCLVTAGCR